MNRFLLLTAAMAGFAVAAAPPPEPAPSDELRFVYLTTKGPVRIAVHLRHGDRPYWQLAPILGIVFVAVLLAVQWPFADFLMSEHARNRVFGAHYMPYMMRPGWHEARYAFFDDPALVFGLVRAAGCAIGASLIGLVLGDAMRRVKR